MDTSLGGAPVLRHLVAIQLVPPIVNSLTTRKQACVRLFEFMPPFVIVTVATGGECLKAAIETALVRLLSLVHAQMLHQISFLVESFLALYSGSLINPGASKYLIYY